METISVADARKADAVGKQVRLQGWIRTRRDCKGGFCFLELNDGSCQGNIQIVADGKLPNYESEIKHLTAGCSVTIEGEVKASPGKGQATEVAASQVVVHGGADPETYPLQKKGHSFEFLRTHRPSAAAHEYLRRHCPGAQSHQPVDPSVLSGAADFCTSTRRSSRPAIAKGPGRCSRSPRSTWQNCPRREAPSITPRISSSGRRI